MDKPISINLRVPSSQGKKTKLEILYADENVLALLKPAGLLIDAHPWFEGIPSIIGDLRKQLKQPSSKLHPFENIYSIYALEPEVTGVALMAKNKETATSLRNEFGSSIMKFKFLSLAEFSEGEDQRECNLPLAAHSNQTRMLVSHKTGKKCSTSFSRIERLGSYDLWEANVDFFRMHQVRLHALECGIRVVGEKLYDHVNPVYYSKLKKDYQLKDKEEEPLSEELCIHLAEVKCKIDQQERTIQAPPTHKWEVTLTKLRKLNKKK